MRKVLLIAVAIAAALPPTLAEARTRQPPPANDSYDAMVRRYYNDPYYGYQNGRVCPRSCPNDRNPCDAPYLKDADGRCYD